MKAPIVQFCALPGNAPDYVIGAFIGIHGQSEFKKTRIAAGVSFSGVKKLLLGGVKIDLPFFRPPRRGKLF
jgi:hypothetical protein